MSTAVASEVYRRQVSALVDVRKYDGAVEVARTWRAEEPENAEAAGNLAWALLRQGQHAEACAHSEEAISLEPEWYWPWRLHSSARFALGKYQDALPPIERAIELAPNEAASYQQLALVLEALDRREEALQALRRSVELAPENGEYRRRLHATEYRAVTEEIDRVKHYFKVRQALALDPANASTLGDLAEIYDNDLGDHDMAESLVRQALEIDPLDEKLQRKLRSIQRERDAWFVAMFAAILPILLLILMAWVRLFRDPTFGKGIGFFVCVALPLLLVGVPLAVLFFLPGLTYVVMASMSESVPPDGKASRSLGLIETSIMLRRLLWTPLAIAWWAALAYYLPVPGTWTVGAILIGLFAAISFNAWTAKHQRRRAEIMKILLAQFDVGCPAMH